jgi:hypothetical protein
MYNLSHIKSQEKNFVIAALWENTKKQVKNEGRHRQIKRPSKMQKKFQKKCRLWQIAWL